MGGGGPAFGLLGSGEFEPWAEEVDRWLLARARPGRTLILPTASALEGDEVFDRWGRWGLEHYRRQGVDAEVLPLRTRSDAERPEFVAALGHAAAVFFSGGNPGYLAETLGGSPFWETLVDQLAAGLAYGGCSAGIAALGEVTTDTGFRLVSRDGLRPGLALFPGTNLAPHWDAMERHVPGIRAFLIETLGGRHRMVTVDEGTALVGDGRRWEVIGTGSAHVLERGRWRHAGAGQELTLAG